MVAQVARGACVTRLGSHVSGSREADFAFAGGAWFWDPGGGDRRFFDCFWVRERTGGELRSQFLRGSACVFTSFCVRARGMAAFVFGVFDLWWRRILGVVHFLSGWKLRSGIWYL